ncbi:hypothetical protein RBB50_004220 [Rhinocladiella similis]
MVKSKIPATRSQDQRSLQQFFSTSFRPPQKRRIDDVVDNDVPPIQATSAPWHPPRMHSSTQVQNPDSVGVLLPALSTTLQSVIPDANLASCDEALTRPGSTLVSATESASNDRLQSDKAYDEPDEIDRLLAMLVDHLLLGHVHMLSVVELNSYGRRTSHWLRLKLNVIKPESTLSNLAGDVRRGVDARRAGAFSGSWITGLEVVRKAVYGYVLEA